MKKRHVLCVDESAFMRDSLKSAMGGHHAYEFYTSPGPQFAVTKFRRVAPECVILAFRSSAKNSLMLLSQIMTHRPVPVIVLLEKDESRFSEEEIWGRGASAVIRCNPNGEGIDEIIRQVRAWAGKKVEPCLNPDSLYTNIFEEAVYPPKPGYEKKISSDRLILIGSSTGGIQVIREIVSGLLPNLPPLLIVQHMPEGFTSSLSHQLNLIGPLYVKEAEDGDILYHGMALIAAGQRHLVLAKAGKPLKIGLSDDPPVNRFRPSVDKLFFSVADNMPREVTAVILTGMGNDGTAGMLKLRERGAFTIAQDEASSAVYGMPREALKSGAAIKSFSIQQITDYLNSLSR